MVGRLAAPLCNTFLRPCKRLDIGFKSMGVRGHRGQRHGVIGQRG